MNTTYTGPELAHLSDLTSTEKMLMYWEHDPDIAYLVTVQDPELKLEDVAAAIMNQDLMLLSDWVLSEQITTDHPTDGNLACLVIRCEPYYVLKLTGEKYFDPQEEIDYLNGLL